MRVRLIALLSFTIVGFACSLAAQDVCRPPTDSHEAKTLATLSVPLTFTGARAPRMPHGVSLGLEVATLPGVDSVTASPTSCRPGKEAENTRPISGIVRPRLSVASHGFLFEVSWIPPITVDEVQANLVGLAIARPVALGGAWYLGLRADATLGTLHAPVTCDDAAIANAASECFHGNRSNDAWQPGLFGAEAVVGGGHSRLKPHFGVGYTILRPRFQVDFTNAAGFTNRQQVQVNLQRVALFAGLTYVAGRSSVTAEAYSDVADAVTARVVVRTLLVR